MDPKRQLIISGRDLAAAELVFGTNGNLSVKDGQEIIITASGANLSHLTGHDVVHVDFEGKSTGTLKPSIELNLHLEIYRKRPDVGAIAHTHSPYATTLSYLNEKLLDVNPEAIDFSDTKICPFIPAGTIKLAKEVVKYIGDQPAVLLGKHGAVCVGSDLEEAVSRASVLEEIAKITYLVKLAKK